MLCARTPGTAPPARLQCPAHGWLVSQTVRQRLKGTTSLRKTSWRGAPRRRRTPLTVNSPLCLAAPAVAFPETPVTEGHVSGGPSSPHRSVVKGTALTILHHLGSNFLSIQCFLLELCNSSNFTKAREKENLCLYLLLDPKVLHASDHEKNIGHFTSIVT